MTVVILLLACFLGRPIDFTYLLSPYFTFFMVLRCFTLHVYWCVSAVCRWFNKSIYLFIYLWVFCSKCIAESSNEIIV